MTDVDDIRLHLTNHLERLPLLPNVLVQLIALDRGSKEFPDQVVELVQSEANFTTRVLAVANSAASSPMNPIDSVRAAVARVGAAGAADLVLTFGVASVFVPRDDWDRSLWRHALQVAVMGRMIAQSVPASGVRPDVAHSAGLIHDVGRFILFQLEPAALRRIDEGTWATPDELVAEERKICGIDHAELGAIACESWGLPSTLVDVVRHHHMPSRSAAVGTDRHLVDIVYVSDRLMFSSAALGATKPTPREAVEAIAPRLPEWLHLDFHRFEDLANLAVLEAERLAHSIGL